MHPSVHCSIVYNSQVWKQPRRPSWRNGEDAVHAHARTHAHTHTLLSYKKECHLYMGDLDDTTLSEIGQTEEDKYCMISLIYGI